MAHAETVGFGACPSCGGQVAWKQNRAGLAYCRCDHCGAETRDHWSKTSTGRLRQFAAPAAGDGVEEGAANRRESPPQKAAPPRPAASALSILGMLGGGA